MYNFIQKCRRRRVDKGWRDAKALSNLRHRNAKLNELPKQIFMLLPLLLVLLLLPYVRYHVLTRWRLLSSAGNGYHEAKAPGQTAPKTQQDVRAKAP